VIGTGPSGGLEDGCERWLARLALWSRGGRADDEVTGGEGINSCHDRAHIALAKSKALAAEPIDDALYKYYRAIPISTQGKVGEHGLSTGEKRARPLAFVIGKTAAARCGGNGEAPEIDRHN
jgi:hypothetical protein